MRNPRLYLLEEEKRRRYLDSSILVISRLKNGIAALANKF